ncbi:MAG: ABC transporter permease [Planctomycetota bacterium]|nr:MAG: ABC transporter permease [Planctomycetota bacterium]
MRAILALALKDLRLLVRDKTGAFFTFVFPVLYASLFGVIMSGFNRTGGGGIGLRVAVVDQDQTDGSRAFVQEMQESREFDVELFDSQAAAANAVRHGRRAAYVVLPPGFGAARENMFFGQTPELHVGIDPARQAEAAMLEGLLTAALFEGAQELFTDPERMAAQVDRALAELDTTDDADPAVAATLRMFLPALKTFMQSMPRDALVGGGGAFAQPRIEVTSVARERTVPRSSFEITFPQGVVWGIMGCASGFGIGLVVERTRGTLMRLRTSPLSRTQILAGKGMACLLTTLIVSVLLFAFAYVVFGVRPDSYAKLALATLCSSLCFVGVMMLLSVLGKTEQSAGGIGWAVMLVFAMIGGGMVPLVFLPTWLQSFASISPIKWAILSLEGAIWRGFSYGEMALPCMFLLGFGVVCYLAGVRAFRWTA